MEWLIFDDGTDPIGDLLERSDLQPMVKYHRLSEHVTLGKKRNMMNDAAVGDILIYMDDDDFYPSLRVEHAVETLLANPDVLCAGCSTLFIYFKHISMMYQMGPYGPNHATAATFAFRKELLKLTRYNDAVAVGEECDFLKRYTIPLVQLDPLKTILVFSHIHNSYDKKDMLPSSSPGGIPNPFVHPSSVVVSDFMDQRNNTAVMRFFMEDIDKALSSYNPGHPDLKPDVNIQILTKKCKIQEHNFLLKLQTLEAQNAKLLQDNEHLHKTLRELLQRFKHNK